MFKIFTFKGLVYEHFFMTVQSHQPEDYDVFVTLDWQFGS